MKKASLLCATAIVAFASQPVHAASDPMSKTDSDMKKVLDAQASLNPKPIETLTPDEARQQPTPADGVKLILKQKGKNPGDPMGVDTKDITIPGGITARVYTPQKHGNKPLPLVVYYHGGGWVLANLDTYDATPRETAKEVKAVVVSVEYRHAPENKFPAAHEDAFTAYQWVVNNALSLGGDPSKIAVMGESAGANLAIDTAIAARDGGIETPVYEVLVYPVAGTDMNTKSYQENANAKPLNKPMMVWFINNVTSSPADLQDPRLNIVGNANLDGLPPATVITAQIDPLRSEGEALAQKLKDSGVKVDAKTYSGVAHEFFGMGAVVSKAKDAEARVNADLKSAFAEAKSAAQ